MSEKLGGCLRDWRTTAIFDHLAEGKQINYRELVEHFKERMHWSKVNLL